MPKANPAGNGTTQIQPDKVCSKVPKNEQINNGWRLHLGRNRAGYGELNINVHLGGLVLEVYGGEVLVVRL